ncbi:MAG: hypothetical protein BWX50_01099 [Euryarchaeota archaeon ADurb.Bin009]|nr:MAG: hypothetical protein BWX50_01099 [Euryarchaeota archaeon ADurb.Bin009]
MGEPDMRRREIALDDVPDNPGEIGLQDRENVHRLRITESGVELDDLRAVAGVHELAVEDPPVRRPLVPHGRDRILHDPERFLVIPPGDEGKHVVGEGVRTHTAGVRPHVTLVCPFVVLDERHGHQVLAVDERLEGELFTDEPLLQHDIPPDLPDVPDRSRHVDVFAHDPHTLPSGEPDGLDGEIAAVGLDEPPGLLRVLKDPVLRASRDTVPLHQPAAERLICLDAGRGPGRPHAGYPRRLEVVDDACLKGRLRPDDRNIDPVLHGEPDDTREIGLIGEKHPLREPGNSRVLSCHDREELHVTVAGKRPGDSMLPATTPHNE